MQRYDFFIFLNFVVFELILCQISSFIVALNERQRCVLKIISDSKRTIFTPKELSTQFNISTRTVRTDLQELVGMGYLSTINLNKRAIGYIKSPNFEELL
ncbi:MAG: HTH domain-containing protein [Bacteroidales bacterium]|nr:HTH domain-containing protein [Bacteroidales bacterium]